MTFKSVDFWNKYQRPGVAHHMTAISNLKSIFSEKALCSYNLMKSKSYENLANDEVQTGRAEIKVPGGLALHDYVPLYMTFKTPMSAANQHRNLEWVYLSFNLEFMAAYLKGVMLADGNARSKETQFGPMKDLTSFDMLNWSALQSPKWRDSEELKRQRQAEVLVPHRLPLNSLMWISTFNDTLTEFVKAIIEPFEHRVEVTTREGWFFS